MTEAPRVLAAKPALRRERSRRERTHGTGHARLLDVALEQLRLEGAIFFRSELTEPFAFESTPLAMAGALHPGATGSSCSTSWPKARAGFREARRTPLGRRPGDVIVLPYGDRHRSVGGTTPSRSRSQTLLDPLPWTDIPLFRHGGGGQRTELVCGYLYSEDPLFDPTMRAFPPRIRRAARQSRRGDWVQASVAYAARTRRADRHEPEADLHPTPELVLIEVLRSHLVTAPGSNHGMAGGAAGPRVRASPVAPPFVTGAEVDRRRLRLERQCVALAPR